MDVSVIVRLMSLCACGQVSHSPSSLPSDVLSKDDGSSGTSGLGYLSSSIGALIQDNHSARNKLLKLCTKVKTWSKRSS